VTRRSVGVAGPVRRLVESWCARGTRTVGEHDADRLLELYGLPVARHVLLRGPAEAAEATATLRGPYVVKVASPDLPHRSDFGGVVVGIADTTGVAAAVEAVIARTRAAHPEAVIDGVIVAEAALPGTELIAGVRVDPTFGPAVMVGLGGIWTEVLHDTMLRLPPIDPGGATEMLRSLRGAELLFGRRGSTGVDVDAIADVIVRLGELARDLGDAVVTVEANPLIAYPDGVRIVDALVELTG
jgi:acetyltransferase